MEIRSFTINADTLLSRLKILKNFKNNVTNVTDGICFENESGVLTISSTDTENFVSTRLNSAIDDEFSFIISSDEIPLLLKLKGNVYFTLNYVGDKGLLTVDYGKKKFQIPVELEDRPEPPVLGSRDMNINVDASFSEAVSNAHRFTSDDETRLSLCGVYLDFAQNQKTAIVATDAHWLKRQYLPIYSNIDYSAILNNKIAKYMHSIFPNGCEMSFDGLSVSMKSDHYEVISKLTDDQYPNYSAVIPEDHEASISINRESLIEALEFTTATVGKSSFLDMNIKKGSVDVFFKSENVDTEKVFEDRSKVDVKYHAEPSDISIRISSKLFLSLIKLVGSSFITIIYNGMNRALLIKENGTTFLVMPALIESEDTKSKKGNSEEE